MYVCMFWMVKNWLLGDNDLRWNICSFESGNFLKMCALIVQFDFCVDDRKMGMRHHFY